MLIHTTTNQQCCTNWRDFATDVILQESEAVRRCAELLDGAFDKAVSLIAECNGSVVVSGVGKSGLIGQKLSATFASTGTPSHFMHATDAMHGDLGRVSSGDVVLLLSNSGTTDEVIGLAAVLRQDQVSIVSITGVACSPLGRLSDAVLCLGKIQEACPYNLAPTNSTASMMALGDALALTVSQARSFSADEFHKRHPGGTLGKKTLPVRDVLRFEVGKNTAVVHQDSTLRHMLLVGEEFPRRCGAVLIVDDDERLAGIVTDGDLRRLLVKQGPEVLAMQVATVMTVKPIHITANDLVKDAVQIVREHRLDEIPVVDGEGHPIGVLDVQDLIALKIVDR